MLPENQDKVMEVRSYLGELRKNKLKTKIILRRIQNAPQSQETCSFVNTFEDHQSNTLNIKSAIVFKQSKSKLEHLHYNPALQLVLENGEHGERGIYFQNRRLFRITNTKSVSFTLCNKGIREELISEFSFFNRLSTSTFYQRVIYLH